MSTSRRRFLAAAAALLAGAPLSRALAQGRRAPPQLSPQDQADLRRAEEHLNGITTMRARFTQVGQDGGNAEGMFSLARPGRLRLQYDLPTRDFVVADGTYIYHWDDKLQQQQQTSIGSSLADFILRPNIKLSGDVTVTGVQRRPGRLEISLVQTDEPGQGELTLVFEDGPQNQGPLALRQWRVVDAQGLITTVTLFGVETGVQFPRDQFAFVRPDQPRGGVWNSR